MIPTAPSSDRLDQILTLPAPGDADLPTLLQALYDRRYTGSITLHFHAGLPRIVEFPRPQIKLT